ncbi:hypothetical protein DFH27DRAFT_488264 [Peziza echinospora]|nr:hypothetical protein DFH27DRAFT_488264 [Peziza echinospora]
MTVSHRASVAGEGDHLYTSGLRRIRQGTPHPTPPSSAHPYANGAMSLPGSRMGSISLAPTSPSLNSCEDLARFPSESLHSFSFAHQSEDFLHSRQNILKRSLEFMRDKFTWASPMVASAHAKVIGDEEVQSMMDLLQRANLINAESTPMLSGPATGPAGIEGNPFEKSFSPPGSIDQLVQSPSEKRDAKPFGDANLDERRSEASSSRSATNDSSSTSKTSPPPTRRASLKRTYTDTTSLTMQTKLIDALAKPYIPGAARMSVTGSSVHGHTNRYAPTSQAIFTTTGSEPWTILAANDLACLVFGLTQAEIRKIGILEVVKVERREWLRQRLESSDTSYNAFPYPHSHHGTPSPSIAQFQNGIRATNARRVKTTEAHGPLTMQPHTPHHNQSKSRGVLLCGDVVPIQKRNGATGAASLWVKEKKGGLIWVLEEIMEDVALLYTSPNGKILRWTGDSEAIFGEGMPREDLDVGALVPELPRSNDGDVDFPTVDYIHNFTAANRGSRIPCGVAPLPSDHGLRVSSFPHIAGIVVLSASTLLITSSNAVFAAALFGHQDPVGLHISQLIPHFDRLLNYLVEEDKVVLVDGMVVPEHSFRKAKAMLSLREGKEDAAQVFARQNGLPAKHRDGGEIRIDVQLRVVNSTSTTNRDQAIIDESEEFTEAGTSEIVYALWITYSRDLHGTAPSEKKSEAPILKRAVTPPRPTSVQLQKNVLDSPRPEAMNKLVSHPEALTAPTPPSSDDENKIVRKASTSTAAATTPPRKKVISDFYILEDMGQGAYGQVKLARYKRNPSKRVVLKYVTKKRILVDTWTRDRKLGTVPLEIHVLDFLGREGLKHPNIVELSDFFEDDINYYIEMVPHGLPGMDLFDYIELRANMDEEEARNIFVQVARAIHHLHTKAMVVHRDIKDENVVLDGDGNIKLIDFGSAAYIKNGPFDVFVGTVDYAAPEVLAGNSYAGKPQDIWALGVLLYTICYKENPFYNIDEIMDRELRIPHIISPENLDLIRLMLDRDVERRPTIEQVLAHPWFEGLPGPAEALAIAQEKEREFLS